MEHRSRARVGLSHPSRVHCLLWLSALRVTLFHTLAQSGWNLRMPGASCGSGLVHQSHGRGARAVRLAARVSRARLRDASRVACCLHSVVQYAGRGPLCLAGGVGCPHRLHSVLASTSVMRP